MSNKWYSIKAFSAAAGQAARPPEIDIWVATNDAGKADLVALGIIIR